MNKEQILSIVRYVLTALGVVLVTRGNTDEITYTQISGAILAAISGIWSIIDKTDAKILAKAEEVKLKLKK